MAAPADEEEAADALLSQEAVAPGGIECTARRLPAVGLNLLLLAAGALCWLHSSGKRPLRLSARQPLQAYSDSYSQGSPAAAAYPTASAVPSGAYPAPAPAGQSAGDASAASRAQAVAAYAAPAQTGAATYPAAAQTGASAYPTGAQTGAAAYPAAAQLSGEAYSAGAQTGAAAYPAPATAGGAASPPSWLAEAPLAASAGTAGSASARPAGSSIAASVGGGQVGEGWCSSLGCGTHDKSLPCQCNNLCEQYSDCCPDYEASCQASAGQQGPSLAPSGAAQPAHAGPLEFSGGSGPENVAGTKVVQAGQEDLGAENEYTHDPQPPPPRSYKTENPPMTVMLYRAQSDQDYPMRNVNLADLPGVMWYLHNEIVGFPDPDWSIRHFNITRIIRYKANIWNPQPYFEDKHYKFGPYVAYNAGKCEDADKQHPHCDRYQDWGAVVGCQYADPNVANYSSSYGQKPVWVSLPGPCPTHEYGAKPRMCMSMSPGGDCGKGKPVTGARDCSFTLEDYGSIRLDDLLPLSSDGRKIDFKTFYAVGGREYDKETDQGVYTAFWDGILDPVASRQRMEAVQQRFQELYPQLTDVNSYPDIACDFW